MKNSNLKNISASAFARQSASTRQEKGSNAMAIGSAIALSAGQLASAQERAFAQISMINSGQQTLPAAIAAIAGKGASLERVEQFINDANKILDKVHGNDREKKRDTFRNYRRAGESYARKMELEKCVMVKNKATGNFHFAKPADEEKDSGQSPAPENANEANAEKANAKQSAAIKKAENKARKMALAEVDKLVAERTANLAEQLRECRAELASTADTAYRMAVFARHYGSDAASAKAKRALTMEVKRLGNVSKAAHKAAEQKYTLPTAPAVLGEKRKPAKKAKSA